MKLRPSEHAKSFDSLVESLELETNWSGFASIYPLINRNCIISCTFSCQGVVNIEILYRNLSAPQTHRQHEQNSNNE